MGFLGFVSMMEAQMMAKGEDNVESCVDESSSSILSEDALSRADVNEVITWLKPVGEARVDVFWRKFSFPPIYGFLFPH